MGSAQQNHGSVQRGTRGLLAELVAEDERDHSPLAQRYHYSTKRVKFVAGKGCGAYLVTGGATQADVTALRGAGYDRPFTSLEDGIASYWAAVERASHMP